MSIEVIQKVTQAENSAQARKQEAVALAKRELAQAEQLGAERLAKAREEADTQVKQFLAEAEAEAKKREDVLMEQTEQDCEALRRAVATKLFEAAELIVGRVVGV